ncbi:MAG: cupin domain protein [Myxococcaceae bacterium]|nr:cupin domain protein [Myxococcaceae bacterium]
MLSMRQSRSAGPVSSYAHTSESELSLLKIEPEWVLEGEPISRVKQLHVTPDKRCEVALWECTKGRFRWHFYCDELVHVLDGEVVIREDDGSERTLRSGDTALFPRGSTNIWHVPHFVRKIATLRYHRQTPLDLLERVVRKAKKELRRLYARARA